MASISAAQFKLLRVEGNNKFARRILHIPTGVQYMLCSDSGWAPRPRRYYRHGRFRPGPTNSSKFCFALWMAMLREGDRFG